MENRLIVVMSRFYLLKWPVVSAFAITLAWIQLVKSVGYEGKLDLGVTYLIPDTTHGQVCQAQIVEHNTALREAISAGLANSAGLLIGRESTRMQVRAIYATILVGVLSLGIFGKAESSGIRKNLLLLMGATLLLYSLDVHARDMLNRHGGHAKVVTMAYDTLLRITPRDTVWYRLNNTEVEAKFDSLKASSVLRKAGLALVPDLEQQIFYIFPFLSLFFFWSKLKNDDATRRDQTERPRRKFDLDEEPTNA